MRVSTFVDMRSPLRRLAGFACGAALLAALSSPVTAQDAGGGLPLGYIGKSRPVVRAQMEMGIAYTQQALAILESGAAESGMEQAHDIASDAYRLMRFATHGVQYLAARGTASRRVTDPLLETVEVTIVESRHRNIHARLALKNAIPLENRARHLEDAIRGLHESVLLARHALDLL